MSEVSSTAGMMTRAKVAALKKEDPGDAEKEEPQTAPASGDPTKTDNMEMGDSGKGDQTMADDKADGPAIPDVPVDNDPEARKQGTLQPQADGLREYTGSQPQAAVLPPSAQPLMADMPVDKPSPSDIKRNLTPREARQLVELQYHEQLRQYQRWLAALAEAARERRRVEEEQQQQNVEEEGAASSSSSAAAPVDDTQEAESKENDGGAAQESERENKRRKVDDETDKPIQSPAKTDAEPAGSSAEIGHDAAAEG
ncbi:hypothetical protein FOL47_000937 [Perkinsus chesapeaki]|uniref:Uncharacterized protein n=1 Tax=Perkinsus chesapeaki TaxID=330153 RepID=A0A7J6N0X2_PERCH|nr:hypothetical protein FOL47_000937 [Perkinsus chesapeaki]